MALEMLVQAVRWFLGFLLSTKFAPLLVKILLGMPLARYGNLVVAYYVVMILAAVVGLALKIVDMYPVWAS